MQNISLIFKRVEKKKIVHFIMRRNISLIHQMNFQLENKNIVWLLKRGQSPLRKSIEVLRFLCQKYFYQRNWQNYAKVRFVELPAVMIY